MPSFVQRNRRGATSSQPCYHITGYPQQRIEPVITANSASPGPRPYQSTVRYYLSLAHQLHFSHSPHDDETTSSILFDSQSPSHNNLKSTVGRDDRTYSLLLVAKLAAGSSSKQTKVLYVGHFLY